MWKLVSSRESSASRPAVVWLLGREGIVLIGSVEPQSCPVPAAQLPAELDPLGEGNSGCKL